MKCRYTGIHVYCFLGHSEDGSELESTVEVPKKEKRCHERNILIELWAVEEHSFHTQSVCAICITLPRITRAIFTLGLHCKLIVTRSATTSLVFFRLAIC